MKYFIFVLLFSITATLTAEELPIMMELKTKLKIHEDFRGGVEEALTQLGYSLVDEEIQSETMKEQSKSEDGCIDDACLVNTGKMLSATGIVIIEVKERSKQSYLFKARYIDFETGITKKTKQDYFEYNLNNYTELNKFSKKFITEMFGKQESITVKEKDEVTKDNSNEKAVKDDEIETKTIKKEEKKSEMVKIEFITDPNGAEAYDEKGIFLGETPFSVDLLKGLAKFSFEKEGFDKILKEVDIKQSNKIKVSFIDRIFNLKITSNIEGAKVYIDGKLKGKVPYSIDLIMGTYKIKVTKEEYKTEEQTIEIKNKDELINFILKIQMVKIQMVKIPGKKFKMDVTEVTVTQFKECVNAGSCSEKNFQTNSDSKYNNYSTSGKENHPMNAVNSSGADEFCKWSEKRLPTEEEWKYAAKGGENYTYAGSNNPNEVAWYKDNSGNSTHEVGTKKANGYGLYDMSGNIWEWAGTSGVIFGGGFLTDDYGIQVDSHRDFSVASSVRSSIGFRCVQDVK